MNLRYIIISKPHTKITRHKREKTDELFFIKIKNFGSSADTSKRVK